MAGPHIRWGPRVGCGLRWRGISPTCRRAAPQCGQVTGAVPACGSSSTSCSPSRVSSAAPRSRERYIGRQVDVRAGERMVEVFLERGGERIAVHRRKSGRNQYATAIPASNLRAARGLPRVGAVACHRTSAVRVIRAALKPCIAPRLGPNVFLAGKPRFVAKLHRPWPGGSSVPRASLWCAEHDRQLGGASPLSSPMAAKD